MGPGGELLFLGINRMDRLLFKGAPHASRAVWETPPELLNSRVDKHEYNVYIVHNPMEDLMSPHAVLFRSVISAFILAGHLGIGFLMPWFHEHPGERHEWMSGDHRHEHGRPLMAHESGWDQHAPDDGIAHILMHSDGTLGSACTLHLHADNQESIAPTVSTGKKTFYVHESLHSYHYRYGAPLRGAVFSETVVQHHHLSYLSDLSPPLHPRRYDGVSRMLALRTNHRMVTPDVCRWNSKFVYSGPGVTVRHGKDMPCRRV